MGFGKMLAHRDQIVTGVKTLWDLANVFAQRLQVAQINRAGQNLDLPAGIVDVIFLGHREAGPRQHRRQHIAHHRASAMADMHGASGVGRHIFDIDRLALAHINRAIGRAQLQDRLDDPVPNLRLQRHVEETRTGDIDRCDTVGAAQFFGQQVGDFAWRQARRFGQHQGGIGGQVPVARLARGFDHHTGTIQPAGQRARLA